ncbi:MAG: Fic family protein, partial [Veillonella sp.]|nr:Fic family protein [Veillonella sp.]
MHKIYYKRPQEWSDILEARRNSEASMALPISIREYNRRHTYPAFFMYHPEVVTLLLLLETKKTAFLRLVEPLPEIMVNHLLYSFLASEVKASNDIEGVNSSRREINEAIKDQGNKGLRFSSIVAKYLALGHLDEPVKYTASQDVRDAYDEVLLAEISKADWPDGQIFRKGVVDLVSAQGKVIHRGLLPESEIVKAMDQALDMLNDESLQLPIRLAIFHYYFGYIHPFYDGNGRLNRFVTTMYLASQYHPLIALRLSEVIKYNQKLYNQAFKLTTSEHNGGDVTFFVV